jgi:D-alanyl-lipoteichoic acid acyltransferase DltB (MBOAT superfamily)
LLFNDPVFLFLFLPVVLIGYYIACSYRLQRVAIWWLLVASVAFYVYDDVGRLMPLIAGSIALNHVAGTLLRRKRSAVILAAGVGANLVLLGYFKYAQFFAENVAALAGRGAPTLAIVLPIGISFYTFTQIAFVVDVYRGHAGRYRLSDYALFVTIFPHLVAGPILRHNETVPQFERAGDGTVDPALMASGWAWFALGLGKKVLFADSLAPYADALFSAADRGAVLSSPEAWLGTLAYSLQLYFDFSGYSDMAIGLALMIGFAFPLNFNSPYKAASLIDFWRRWHMTLSSFLRDYLYIPLGGNRRGELRRYVNLMVTMVLGGLWHGASWNFILWGAMHGAGLALNYAWRAAAGRWGVIVHSPLGRIVTMAFVVLAWVPFRAESIPSAMRVWDAMIAFRTGGSLFPAGDMAPYAWVGLLGLIALAAPNTQEILGKAAERSPWRGFEWRPSLPWAVAVGVVFGLAISRTLSQPTTFLYFRF